MARREPFPGKYLRAIELEAEASVIEEYASATVPGLLQTRDVATFSLHAGHPHTSPIELKQMIDARMKRQESMCGAKPPRWAFILDEAVLRRPVGSPAVMAAQLGSIIRRSSESSYITVQVLRIGRVSTRRWVGR
ncbi:hypothetical protein GXW82_32060 [Streptacidiphilus sp. 4-A2]|nr:hypothetical protein [Streptacidiphilus sp. 4-A2]